ncbi:MAG: 2-oxoacid:acceptor oxidoreductase family protein [bacterium]|nr:2-oxoacid:acceptor oxidoreductase family protein [bacterium]
MAQMVEIRWHGRGGQGVKTAATMLAEAALNEGKHSQGFPEYGPERMGAPVRGYTRLSEEAIVVHCAIYNPQVVVVLDPTLLMSENVAEGLIDGGKILVNTPSTPAEVRKQMKLNGNAKIFTVNATQIALDELKRDIPNTPMVGALVKISEVLKLETVEADLKKKFDKKFRPEVVEGNLRAVHRAYNEVKGE